VEEAIVEHDEGIEQLEASGEKSSSSQEVLGEVGFGDVVAGQSSAEVCRIFLACLQLVNHGSLSIIPAADMNQWSFMAPAVVALKGSKASKAAPSAAATTTTTTTRKGIIQPFKIRRIKTSKANFVSDDIENYRAPSLNKTVQKGALKSASSSKVKGTKRVQMNLPSNITITI
jgi:hypothetical protein